MTIQNNTERFRAMKIGLEPTTDPGYLQYWADREANDPSDARVHRIVEGLTKVAIHGEKGDAEFTHRQPALQARYWYRSLGPLNPMTDVEPDLITAAQMMYGNKTSNSSETANLELDAAYAISEIARVTERSGTRNEAILMALEAIKDIKANKHFNERDAHYKLQAHILERDLRQDAVRVRHTGTINPKPSPTTKEYRSFEGEFTKEELRGIEAFSEMVSSGINEENFGILFEWANIITRRHKSWQDEMVDKVLVRGATSRENAEWTGDHDPDNGRISGNHDVVVDTYKGEGNIVRDRLQLKTVKASSGRTYHPRVTVLDFEEVLDQRFTTINGATNELGRSVSAIRREYIENL